MFGDGAFKEIIKVKWGHKVVSLYKEEKTPVSSAVHRGKAMWGYSTKAAVYKPRREGSLKTNLDNTLILDLVPLELWEN